MKRIIKSTNGFGLDDYSYFSSFYSISILRRISNYAKTDENIALSPLRLQALLALIANWSWPRYRDLIEDKLHLYLPDANMLLTKERLLLTPRSEEDRPFCPTIEQKTFIWLSKQLKANKEALEEVGEYYDIDLKSVDFKNAETKAIIDETVEKATHGLIEGIDADIDPETMLMITDILYFKAKWEEEFDEAETDEQPFYGTIGEAMVPMMHRQGLMDYGETDKFQVVRLPYMCMSEEEKSFSMRIYLPKDGYTPTDIIIERYEGNEAEMKEEEVELSIPRFTVQSNMDMYQLLLKMGLECIYESDDIIPALCMWLRISYIGQEVKIMVNERETEAAALTFMCDVGCPPPAEEPELKIMNVNRPFLFEIAEDTENLILFTGIMNNITE